MRQGRRLHDRSRRKAPRDVRYQAHSDGLARREGDELVVPLAPSTTMTSQLAPLVKRTLPVVLPPSTAPSHQTRTIRVLPPPDTEPPSSRKGGEENGGEFGYAKVEIEGRPGNPRGVLVKRTVVFDMSTIPRRQIRRLARMAAARRRAVASLGPLLALLGETRRHNCRQEGGGPTSIRKKNSQGVWEFLLCVPC